MKKPEPVTAQQAGKHVDECRKAEKNSRKDLAIKKKVYENAQDKHKSNVKATSAAVEQLTQVLRSEE